MTEKETNPNQAADLRREAEKIIWENTGNNRDSLPQGVPVITTPPQDLPTMTSMLHELRVHQIELEMQNREHCARDRKHPPRGQTARLCGDNPKKWQGAAGCCR
ncbi:MAG: hypothetical protein ACOYOS_22475 [Syntrophales bacterium]